MKKRRKISKCRFYLLKDFSSNLLVGWIMKNLFSYWVIWRLGLQEITSLNWKGDRKPWRRRNFSRTLVGLRMFVTQEVYHDSHHLKQPCTFYPLIPSPSLLFGIYLITRNGVGVGGLGTHCRIIPISNGDGDRQHSLSRNEDEDKDGDQSPSLSLLPRP